MLRRLAPEAAESPPSFEEFQTWMKQDVMKQDVRTAPRSDA